MKTEFWRDWKKITPLEKRAIKSLKIAKKIVLDNVPKEEILAIYAKGTFIRREMNKDSDVDIVPIFKTGKYALKLKRLQKKYKHFCSPPIQFAGYTLWELKTGKKSKVDASKKANPDRFTKHLEHYKLIYGKEIDPKGLIQSGDKVIFERTLKVFNNVFIPRYEKKEMWFTEIVKQVFWLVEFEQRTLGKKVPHSWKKLTRSIKDKDHIIHDTLKYRLKKPKDKKLRAAYIKKLKSYLEKLEKL